MTYYIYTDGSTRNNGYANSIGAWGYVIVLEDIQNIGQNVGVVRDTTNQQMELEACARACEHAALAIQPFDEVKIITDSAYIHNCCNQKWYEKWQNNGWLNSRKEPVANREKWERLIPFFDNAQFQFIKTKGHSVDKWNCYVDRLVQNATLKEKENDRNNNSGV